MITQKTIDDGPKYFRNFNSEYKERVSEQVMEKGRSVHKITYKTIKPADRFKGFRASDFDLQTLISLGALDNKGECYLSGSTLIDTDKAESSMENLVQAAENEINTKNGGNE